jgi:MFS family permease
VNRLATSLPWVLGVTFLASLGTGVFWHGLAFIAKHAYGFDQTRNLVLFGVMGAIYTVGAFQAGRIDALTARRLSARGLLAWAFSLQGLVCLLPIAAPGEWTLWVTAAVVSLLSSVVWPIVESYVTSGRHGPAMRSAIGWFNVTWMPAMAVPMFLMAPLLEHHGEWTFGGLAVANAVAIVAVIGLAPRPAAHDERVAAEHVSETYPFLLRSARVLLPLSYVLMSVMAPILPYRFERLGVDVFWETPSTATWMICRVVALVVMWRLAFWHGRWGTLLLGGLTMAAGFAAVILAPSLPVMLAGFACFGIGLGVVYYAALYYAMSVGRAHVEASGTHEGLIGAGYVAGPILGLAGTALGGGAAIVGLVWGALALSAIPAVIPYASWRRRGET